MLRNPDDIRFPFLYPMRPVIVHGPVARYRFCGRCQSSLPAVIGNHRQSALRRIGYWTTDHQWRLSDPQALPACKPSRERLLDDWQASTVLS
jgi:hypothetical protein